MAPRPAPPTGTSGAPAAGDRRSAGAGAGRRFGQTARDRLSSPFVLNLAPMIDVTFLLLIFFLVSTTFGRPEGILSSRMPKGPDAPAVQLPISPIVVRLTPEGDGSNHCLIQIDHVRQQPAGFTELAQLIRELQQRPGFDRDTPVIIVPQQRVAWDHVVEAWNAALRGGARNLAFAAD